MRIIVTGGAGFIGTNLCKELVRLGHDVVSIDNYHTGTKDNHIDGVRYFQRDIRDIESEHEWCFDYWWPRQKPDVIFHMAAIARIQPSFDKPKEYFTTNANGTLQLIDYCAKYSIPLVYAGSSSHHSGKFKNPYTFSKDIGEELVKLYQKHFNLNSSIVRFYNVYGPHQLLTGGYTTLIGRWLNNISNNIECEIYGDGEQRRDFTHVDDIVNALVSIVERGAYGYEFELGRGQNYSVNEVAEMFNIKPIYKEGKPGEARHTLCDSATAKEILNWTPSIDLQTYIQKEIETYV